MFSQAYTEGLEKALARVLSDAQRQMAVLLAEGRALLAEQRQENTELKARMFVLEGEIKEQVRERLAALRDGKDGEPGKDGRDGQPGEPGRDGKDGEPGRPGLDGKDGKDGEPGQPGEPGLPGEPGEKGLDGKDGKDGREWVVRGTYNAEETYERGHVVALNGGSFVAKMDEPGPCPGEGWQLLASVGKRGNPGEPGKPGLRGDPGLPGATITGFEVEGMMLIASMSDGTLIECDLQRAFEAYHRATR
jgi:hypothetical protein